MQEFGTGARGFLHGGECARFMPDQRRLARHRIRAAGAGRDLASA